MFKDLKFKEGDFVRIKNTSSPLIDGREGIIKGISVNGITQIWIVDFGQILHPIEYPFSIGAIPGSLLEYVQPFQT